MKKKVKINDRSVNSAGIPRDYRHAVGEFIWNGYDAHATSVDIRFDANEIDHIDQLVIVDNGDGIAMENLDQTFGAFLDSPKKASFQRSSYNHGKQGKGRFSFATLASKATWHTTYRHEEKLLEYDIVIVNNGKEEYETNNKLVSAKSDTGTEVILDGLFDVSAFSFSSPEFRDYLAREFGWFLFLNKANGFKLTINGEDVPYEHLISDSDITNLVIKSQDGVDHTFGITYLRWREAIGDRYYFYFLNNQKREAAKRLTSFNNNAAEFHHSVFIQSDFFDDFVHTTDEENEEMFAPTSSSPTFKALTKHLGELLARKQRQFIREDGADRLVREMEQRGVLPVFGHNKYEVERRRDFVTVVKELYCAEPKIFRSLKKEQEVTMLGFLNLVLDTDQREHVLNIVDRVVKLTSEERKELASVLERNTFSQIVDTIKLIENRFKTVEYLKTLVFDLEKFTTERAQLQKAMELNYWLFGEQYHLTSADENFQTLLSNYLYVIDGVADKQYMSTEGWKRRPDLFMCRKRNVPDPQDHQGEVEENIMVELKRPTVVIGKDQFRQIDDYLDIILKEPRFNSQTRLWRFYVVSNEVDDYIEKQYGAFAQNGKRFLVQMAGRYEIYALTWDDVFRTFEIRHRYLFEKLTFDKAALQKELESKGIRFSKEGSQTVTEHIVDLSAAPPDLAAMRIDTLKKAGKKATRKAR